MTDAIDATLHAVATRSPLAYPLALAAGIVTSIGPCAAPRYVAVAALANASRTPWRIVGLFTAGLVGAYVVLGLGAGLVGFFWSASSAVYTLLAVALGAAGIVTLLRGDTHAVCGDTRVRVGGGATFLLGASSALIVSPCCTPIVAGIAGLTAGGGQVTGGAALLAAFACGHAAPAIAVGALGSRVAGALRHVAASHTPAVIAGTLMLALAVYYGMLA
ncbi:MAG: hypothetical protein JO225_16775 [Candidatus Eremiobacteraeota bacterium]|nr:hypothetical protein [Candidatus Eremiobacteraeota bacterium]MBV8645560.1 hypothetical protein [Candidatus Eremiobacteraeota bacterium]